MKTTFANRLKTLAFGALLAVGCSTTALQAESLSDAMVAAYKHSGLLKQNQALLRAADEDVAIAQSALRPSLTYAINHTYSDTDLSTTGTGGWNTSAQLTASILLFDFGRSKAAIEAQKQVVLATRDALVGVEQSVLLRAVQAFLDVRSASENAQLQAGSVRVLTQELRAANDRFEVGEVTKTDVSLAQARLAAARAAEAGAQGQLAIAREEYKAATGAYPGNLTLPKAPSLPAKSLDGARAIARQNHPDILATQHNVSAAEIAIEISKGSMKPTLSGNSSLTRSINGLYSTESNSASVGVTLQGTIYSGGRQAAEYRKAIAQAEAARAGLHQTRHAVEQGVANAWSQIAIATASLEASERQIRASRVALRGAREEAALGSRTTLDVLNADQELLDAEDARITAQSNRYLAIYSLMSSMGLLTVDHLKLGVVTYDPEAYYNAVKNAPSRNISAQGERLDSLLEALSKN